MKVEVKKIDTLRRELKFQIPQERVSQKMDEVYKEIGRAAKIKGFRPGKAPRHVLEASHGDLAREETIKKMIPEAYQEGIEKENLLPVDLPEIHDVAFKDGMISFKAKLDIKPEVKIKSYKGIKVKRKSSAVTDEEVNKTLDYFRKGKGDGKEAVLDDEFAKGLGYPSLDELKKFITRQLEIDKDRQNKMDVENQLIDELIKNTKMSVPQSLVTKQKEYRLSEMRKYYQNQKMSAEDIAKKEKEIDKDLQKAVEKDVKIFFILEKIAQLEGMTVKEGESMPNKVIEFLLKEAKWEEK